MADHLQTHSNCHYYNIEEYVTEIRKVTEDFEIRFHGFEKKIKMLRDTFLFLLKTI